MLALGRPTQAFHTNLGGTSSGAAVHHARTTGGSRSSNAGFRGSPVIPLAGFASDTVACRGDGRGSCENTGSGRPRWFHSRWGFCCFFLAGYGFSASRCVDFVFASHDTRNFVVCCVLYRFFRLFSVEFSGGTPTYNRKRSSKALPPTLPRWRRESLAWLGTRNAPTRRTNVVDGNARHNVCVFLPMQLFVV